MATIRAGRGRGADEKGSTAAFWLLVLAVLALVGFLVAWLGGWIRFTTDPRVAEIRALQEEARAKFGPSGPANAAEAAAAVAAMGAIREKVEALPPNLRKDVERAGGGMMRDMFRNRIDGYFSLPPDRRQAELDRQIDQEEMMRKAFEAGRAVAGVFGGGGGGGSGGGSGQSGAGGGAAGGGQAGGGQGGGGPPRGGSEEDRNRWRKNIIDNTTPEERARYTEYRRAMEDRREQRGLQTGPR